VICGPGFSTTEKKQLSTLIHRLGWVYAEANLDRVVLTDLVSDSVLVAKLADTDSDTAPVSLLRCYTHHVHHYALASTVI